VTGYLAAAASHAGAGETAAFWVVAVIATGCALGMVLVRNAVYSALLLAATMIMFAVAYLAQGAIFLGVVQIVVYTGAVMMLFLFVVMLIGVRPDESDAEGGPVRGHRALSAVAGVAFGVLLIALLARVTIKATGTAHAVPRDPVQQLADLIFVRYLWAFELTAALLITATVGALVLAHRAPAVRRLSQRELSILRFRGGRRATPLPNPGVYALGNAVDLPGRLPDGSPATVSVNRTLTPRVLDAAGAPVRPALPQSGGRR
jgi:NADH-quinone oxidoreductase subunit J